MNNANSLVIAKQVWFESPHIIDVKQQQLPALSTNELLIHVNYSAISAGTEMLVYRGQIPAEMTLDDNISALQGQPDYPVQYGYACVGEVEQIGVDVDSRWLGKRVFAFQPHASHFITSADALIEIPSDISLEAALFLPNMETAVNLIQDGAPALGERALVLGQGIVGLLLSALLAQFPLAQLYVLDALALRRARALQLGATQAFDPFCGADVCELKHNLDALENNKGADLIYEVSGAPAALNLAIDCSGFTSRIVIGSWYGNKSAPIMLGGDAHRNRLKIITSQVSRIDPQLSGRWDKARRFDLVWDMIRRVKPEQFISHRASVGDAPSIYAQLDQAPQEVLQAIFTYSN
ncbi:MAG: oxidoreductase [Pseudomonadota bacterium]|nr:oxidoreductase [Pseudomonadota bacterium]